MVSVNNILSCSVVPKYSDLRQEEILRISDDLSPLFDKNTPQVSGAVPVSVMAVTSIDLNFSSGVETSTTGSACLVTKSSTH